jgi:hypothetical protein
MSALEMMTRRVIRVDGTVEQVGGPVSIREICKLIGCDTVDVVQLRHLGPSPQWVMVVDDTGLVDNKPANPTATELYHANCRPGVMHPICGDVIVLMDEDFA